MKDKPHVRVIIVAPLLMLLLTEPLVAAGPSKAEIAEHTLPSVATVLWLQFKQEAESDRFVPQTVSSGTAFFVSPDCVVTNHHVAAGNYGGFAVLQLADGRFVSFAGAQVIFASKEEDQAVIRLPANPKQYSTSDLKTPIAGPKPLPGALKLTRTLPKAGESLIVVGSPLGLSGSVSDGIVSAVRKLGGVSVLQITAAISPGSSGSPVLDANGDVCGIATSQFEEGQQLNFAMPIAFNLDHPKGEPQPFQQWAEITTTDDERTTCQKLLDEMRVKVVSDLRDARESFRKEGPRSTKYDFEKALRYAELDSAVNMNLLQVIARIEDRVPDRLDGGMRRPPIGRWNVAISTLRALCREEGQTQAAALVSLGDAARMANNCDQTSAEAAKACVDLNRQAASWTLAIESNPGDEVILWAAIEARLDYQHPGLTDDGGIKARAWLNRLSQLNPAWNSLVEFQMAQEAACVRGGMLDDAKSSFRSLQKLENVVYIERYFHPAYLEACYGGKSQDEIVGLADYLLWRLTQTNQLTLQKDSMEISRERLQEDFKHAATVLRSVCESNHFPLPQSLLQVEQRLSSVKPSAH